MNTNSTFQIGKDHIVCEDYALSGNLQDRITFAIVCDGCSASPDVDFGARALAMAARETLSYKLAVEDGLFPGMNPEINAERFGRVTIQKAEDICRNIRQLHPQALDATLLAAFVQGNKLTAYLYGDGVLVHRTRTGINTVHIHLSSGAPDYLSYNLDEERKKNYQAIKDNVKEITVTVNGQTIVTTSTPPLTPYVLNTEVLEGDVIAVVSDGINSFRMPNNDPLDWTTLVDEFTGYKTTEGEFVLRRLAAFKRKCLKENITHSDDISVAAIVV